MTKLLVVLTFLFSVTSWSKPCKIEIYAKNYLLSDNIAKLSKSIIKKSTCAHSTNSEFMRFLITTNGSVSSSQISRIFKALSGKSVTITPKRITVHKLENYLTERLSFSKNWYIRELKSLNPKGVITLNNNENITVECPNCNYPGNKSIRIIIQNPVKNKNSYFMLNGKLQIKTMALVPRGIIQVDNQPLSKLMFKKKEVFVDNPANIFTNENALTFYKVNKPLNGKALVLSDLTPVSLVRAGTPTKIYLQTGSISLKSMATPLRSGKYGDTIQLRSTSNNKIIIGKVIDYNKVAIEL
ncbi:hypothetical protein A9Q84_20280 [Halobacteriovorax marinus]|uniref:Flagella basal body P-ring formation protein FlgA SAF domain-containing protein n=1 Tax=Halobacteriovorax marinus TaxID=97084 RepID=A0A1Y5F7I2_9BACT|nr:hypothetical protein A9Q84_20280 [Halobacteriovorax marinus]